LQDAFFSREGFDAKLGWTPAAPAFSTASPVKPQAGQGKTVGDVHELSICDLFAQQCE